MNYICELLAEIDRLRAVCEGHDVDPDWAPEPELYGPPKALDAISALTLKACTSRFVADINRDNAFMRWLNGPDGVEQGEDDCA